MTTDLQKTEPAKLPTIGELRDDESLAIRERENSLNVLLNQEPKEAWIRTNKFANNSKYLPIARVEWLLTRIYVQWYTEVLRVDLVANSIAVTVRLHYLNPVTGAWAFTDGVGASRMQVESGKGATDFMFLKDNAVEIGLPKAKTEAIKDAAGDLGRLFGRDLNRKDAPEYASLLGQFDSDSLDEMEIAEVEALLGTIKDPSFRENFFAFFDIQSLQVKDIPRHKLRAAKARILDYEN